MASALVDNRRDARGERRQRSRPLRYCRFRARVIVLEMANRSQVDLAVAESLILRTCDAKQILGERHDLGVISQEYLRGPNRRRRRGQRGVVRVARVEADVVDADEEDRDARMQRLYEIAQQNQMSICGLAVEAGVVHPDVGKRSLEAARHRVGPRLAVREKQTLCGAAADGQHRQPLGEVLRRI